MKTLLLPVSLTALLVASTAVIASPADDFGKAMLKGATVSADVERRAAEILSGDDLEDRVTYSDDLISTQNVGISQGHMRLAAEMGVNPADYTNAELAKMYIDAHD